MGLGTTMYCQCLLLHYDVWAPPREAKGAKSRDAKVLAVQLNRFIVIHKSKCVSQTWLVCLGSVATLGIGS